MACYRLDWCPAKNNSRRQEAFYLHSVKDFELTQAVFGGTKISDTAWACRPLRVVGGWIDCDVYSQYPFPNGFRSLDYMHNEIIKRVLKKRIEEIKTKVIRPGVSSTLLDVRLAQVKDYPLVTTYLLNR